MTRYIKYNVKRYTNSSHMV